MVDNETEAKSLLMQLAMLRRKQMVLRYASTAAVLLLFVIFAARGYALVRNFDNNHFATALKERAANALPDLHKQLDQMLSTLLPVYMDEVTRQAETRLPQLQAHADAEIGVLGTSLMTALDKRMHGFRDDIEKITEDSLKANYPALAANPAALAQAKLHVVGEFEAVAGAALEKRVKEPASDFKRILLAANKLGTDARAARTAKGGAPLKPEVGVVVSLMGVLGRKLVDERATVIKAAQE